MRDCRPFLAGIPHLGVDTHVLLTRPPLPLCLSTPASRQERHLYLSDPGQVMTLSLFADSSCSEIDRNCSCSLTVRFQLLFCFHSSIVKVLISPCHLAIASQMTERLVHSLAVAQVVCHISSILSRGLLLSLSLVNKLIFCCPLVENKAHNQLSDLIQPHA